MTQNHLSCTVKKELLCLDQISLFNEDSIKSLIDATEIFIENYLLKQIDEKCSVKDLEKIFQMIGLKSKFKGSDKKNKYKKFIQDHIRETYNHINHLALIFEREEEDRTNKIHLKRRREVLTSIDKLQRIFTLTQYSTSKYRKNYIVFNRKP